VVGGNVSEQAVQRSEDGIVVEVGSEFLEHGKVQVHVAPDGRVRVDKREQGKEDRFEGRTDEARAKQMSATVEGLRGATYGQRRGVPDEPRYRLRVVRDGATVAELEVWRSELEEVKELGRIIAELSELAQRASNGQALV